MEGDTPIPFSSGKVTKNKHFKDLGSSFFRNTLIMNKAKFFKNSSKNCMKAVDPVRIVRDVWEPKIVDIVLMMWEWP